MPSWKKRERRESSAAAVAWLAEASDGKIPIGSTGNPPVLANITSLDGTITVTNGPGTIDLSATSIKGTTTTIGAVTADILTIPLGVIAGTFQLEARVKAYDSVIPSAAGYNLFSTVLTDGITGTLIGNQPIYNESMILEDADAYFVVVGNNAILRVLGVAAITLDWTAETQIT